MICIQIRHLCQARMSERIISNFAPFSVFATGAPPHMQGDDAINFFAQYGANSPIKFVHLVRANKGHDFPPYDLVVVNPRECSGDYYLMSSAGLVHVCHGEPSEFTPLSEWMRQSTMFNMLQSIRFFKCYLHSKCFKLWRDNVRYKLFCQQRRKLSHRLFLAKESFAGPYVELRRHMIDMQVLTCILCAQRTQSQR